MPRNRNFKPLLFAFSLFALVWSALLLFAGGFTTSIDAGMAFLDWPLSNGSLNPEGWTEDPAQAAEHSHRLLGLKLGLLAIVLAIWTWRTDDRGWVRWLTLGFGGMILFQGILGGLRVLLDPANLGPAATPVAYTFRILHAMGAHATLAFLVTVVIALSPIFCRPDRSNWQTSARSVVPLAWTVMVLTLAQILVGALMRHAHAGLAIPTFPHSTFEGDWLPPDWNRAVVINFIHRVGAFVLTAALAVLAWKVFRDGELRKRLGGAMGAAVVLTLAQIVLGAATVWSGVHPHAATMHMLFGAGLSGTVWGITFAAEAASRRLALDPGREMAATGRSTSPASRPAEPVVS